MKHLEVRQKYSACVSCLIYYFQNKQNNNKNEIMKVLYFFTMVTHTVTFLCSAPFVSKVDCKSWKRSCVIRKFEITYLFLSSSKRIGLWTFQTNHWINWNIKNWVKKNERCWSHEYCTSSYHVLDYYLTHTLTLLFHQSFVNSSEIHTLTKNK